MPSFLTSILTIVAIALNNKFGWHLSPDKLIASVALTINFVLVTLSADIAKLKNGERPNFNSTKLFTLVFSCLMIGFSSYIGIDLNTEEVIIISGAAAAFITGKGIKDIVQTKQSGGVTNLKQPYNDNSFR
jgi:hypothetical protein